MLYFAYGSNLNKEQMKARCPKAKPIGFAVLEDHRLVFRDVADVIPSFGSEVKGAVWKITKKCLKALDRYEGYPKLYGRLYYAVYLPEHNKHVLAMVYHMNSSHYKQPSAWYLQSILQGYKDFKIKPEQDILKPNIGVGMSYCERCENTGVVIIPEDMDGVERTYACMECDAGKQFQREVDEYCL